MEFSFLLLLLIGLIAGVLAGVFGIGGGVLFTPILFLLFNEAGLSQTVLWTIGTSLFCTFIAATGSSIRQFRQNNFYWREGIQIGLLGAVGVWVGKQVATSAFYTEKVFAIFFSLLFFYVAYMFIKRGRDNEETVTNATGSITVKKSSITGGAGGFVAALAGIGGGSVMVPIMNLYYRLPIQKAVSISSLAIVFISLSGWIQLCFQAGGASLSGYALGVVDFGAALPLSVGGLTGGFAGAFINLKVDRQYLQYGFALLALIIVVKLLSDVF
ncbi:sulfite exporter TauE/SafE family protein [Aliifodinibius sp. S!AR15-10]|uniref:sulfite exporter TauE/SafE family protein n=1 Tax=Aliifodinibius sp. S!AR15-10 TaxID=2950437 RepID=UPI002865DB13|nr:sulfite exporter TauE/SafE family protein [Aliifodinibius sp. S!AR15-10]MDR8392505.1 sulfite exporter TauE/SafE family protein [Aliifodinibius sp. S!AR15-10]